MLPMMQKLAFELTGDKGLASLLVSGAILYALYLIWWKMNLANPDEGRNSDETGWAMIVLVVPKLVATWILFVALTGETGCRPRFDLDPADGQDVQNFYPT